MDEKEENPFNDLDAERRLEFIGTVQRKVTDRPYRIKFTPDGSIFAVQVRKRFFSSFSVCLFAYVWNRMRPRR
jgi:hypothetical protein